MKSKVSQKKRLIAMALVVVMLLTSTHFAGSVVRAQESVTPETTTQGTTADTTADTTSDTTADTKVTADGTILDESTVATTQTSATNEDTIATKESVSSPTQETTDAIPSDTTAPMTKQKGAMAPVPAGGGDPITVSITAPTKADTFALDGIAAPDLVAQVNITFNQDNVTGGKIIIPIDPNNGSLGTAFYSYNPAKNPSSNWPSMLQDVTFDGANITITLKDNIAQGTNQNLPIYLSFNQDYYRQVLPGTELWNGINADVTTMSPNFTSTVSTAAITTSATDDRTLSVQRMNPSGTDIQEGSTATYRLSQGNVGYYKVDFDPNVPVTYTVYFPVGTQILSQPGFALGTAADGRVTLTRTLSNIASQWPSFHYNNNATEGGHYDSDVTVRYAEPTGSTITVTHEFSYALAGGTGQVITKQQTFTNNIVDAKAWDLKLMSGGYNSSGGTSMSDCNIAPNGSSAIAYIYAIGYGAYGNGSASRNQGSSDITGVEFIMTQPEGVSGKINYNSIRPVSSVESSDYQLPKFQYWFVIKDALTGTTKDTSLTDGKKQINANAGMILPTLGDNEYLFEIHVQPTGINGDQPGVWPPHTSFSVYYNIKTWDGQKWPDDTAMPFQTTLKSPFTLSYNDEGGVKQTVNSLGANHKYFDYGTATISKVVNVDPQGQNLMPGQVADFQIRASNTSAQAASPWLKPYVLVKTLPNLKYVSNGNLYSGTDGSTFPTDQGTVSVEVLHEGTDYNLYKFTSDSDYSMPRTSSVDLMMIPVKFQVQPGTPVGNYKITQTVEGSQISQTTSASNYAYNNFINTNNVPAGDTLGMYQVAAGEAIHFSGASGDYTVVESINLSATSKLLGTSDSTQDLHDTTTPALLTPSGYGKIVMTLLNQGNVDAGDLKLFDIIPRIGDKSLLSSTARGSEWDPTFTGLSVKVFNSDGTEATINNSARLNYSTEKDPAITQIARTGNNPNWITTAPANMNTVGAFYYDFGTNKLKPGQYIEITMQFIVPADAVVNGDQIAYNSYAYLGNFYKGTTIVAPIVKQEPTPFAQLQVVPVGLTGIVYNSEGTPEANPIEGAKVVVADKTNNQTYTVYTDATGKYIVGGLPENAMVDIGVSAPTYNSANVTDFKITANAEKNILLDLSKYTYQLSYYTFDGTTETLLETTTASTAKYLPGVAISDTQISSDFGADWLDSKKPDNSYSNGEVKAYTTITTVEANNVVKIVYTLIPTYSYKVEYYTNEGTTDTLIYTSTVSTTKYLVGVTITDTEITGDFGADWLNSQKPDATYKDGVASSYPTITATLSNNVIKVLYVKDDGVVMVSYQDESGNSLAPDTKLSGMIGTPYQASPQVIAGYTLKASPANESGSYSNTQQTVIYVYSQDPEPTVVPTTTPTITPTTTPTVMPTTIPTIVPTVTPTTTPTIIPTLTPTTTPTIVPTVTPTTTPTTKPTKETTAPTTTPTTAPTTAPTEETVGTKSQVLGATVFTKLPDRVDVKRGDLVNYTLSGIGNPYASVVTDFRIGDLIPDGIEFMSGQIPAFANGTGITYNILYKNAAGVEKNIAQGVDASKSYSLKAPTLATGEKMTELILVFTQIPVDFGTGNSIVYTFKVIASKPGAVITNKAYLSFVLDEKPIYIENTGNSSISIYGLTKTGETNTMGTLLAAICLALGGVTLVATKKRSKKKNAG